MRGLTYWWKKYQNIKHLLADYMKRHKIKTVEGAIAQLLSRDV